MTGSKRKRWMVLLAVSAALMLMLPTAAVQPNIDTGIAANTSQLQTALDRFPATAESGLADSGLAGLGRLILTCASPAFQGNTQTTSNASRAIIAASHSITCRRFYRFTAITSFLIKTRLTGAALSCRAPPSFIPHSI